VVEVIIGWIEGDKFYLEKKNQRPKLLPPKRLNPIITSMIKNSFFKNRIWKSEIEQFESSKQTILHLNQNKVLLMACDGGYSLMLYEHCPAQINLLFLADSIGILTPRFVKW